MKPKWIFFFFALLVPTWVLSSSKPGLRVEGCLDGSGLPVSDQKPYIRVISINMLHGFPSFDHLSQRLTIIANEIIRLNADIVLMQEVPWTFKTHNAAKMLSDTTGMNYAYLRANGNRWTIAFEEGEAILSRFPISEPGFIELEPHAGFFEHRVVLHATILTTWGNLKVFVTHLTNGDFEINRGQSERLMEYIDLAGPHSALLAGDFNAEPNTTQMKVIGSQLIDTFSFGNSTYEGNTCCIDGLNSKDISLRKRIDYIFITPDLLSSNSLAVSRVFDKPFPVEDGWLWASDHAGLILDIGKWP